MRHAQLICLLALGCGGDLSKTIDTTPEGDAAGECTDTLDNDDNGLVDCADPGCAAAPDCTDTGLSPDNAPPSAPTVAITPADPEAGEALTCTLLTPGEDPDGDPVTHRFAWEVGGAGTAFASETVPAAETGPEETWTCIVTPDDGTSTGPSASDSVTTQAANRPPPAAAVRVVPAEPAVNQPLLCEVVELPEDPDGDTVQVDMAWLRDGVETGLAGDTVDRLQTAEGEQWTCVATPSDGMDAGPATTAEVRIGTAQYTGDVTGLGDTFYSASSCFLGCDEPTYAAANAFDDNPGTSGYSTWHTTWTGGPEWIAVDFGEGNTRTITRYGLMGASFHEGYRVRDFELQGSSDGNIWTTVDTVTDANLAYVMYGGEPFTYFEHAHTDAYRHWRLLITDNEDGQTYADEVGIVEIEMFEDAPVE